MTKGERIKYLRESKGLTQTELAEKIGSTKQNVYKYENGIITNIPSDKIECLADVLDVTPSYLMGWEDNSNEEIDNEYYEIEEKLKFVGCKLGFYEEDAYLWIEFPDGSLKITEKDLSELNKSTNDFLKFKLMELRSERPKDFRKKNK